MKTSRLTAERLAELLSYNERTGKFTWISSSRAGWVGKIAGTAHVGDGYIYILIDGVQYRATRLVWLAVYGRWPKEHIDHKNGNPSDDRLVNLREATRSDNLGNRKLNKNSTTGFKGVARRSKNGKFRAYINRHGKREHLGEFYSAEVAHAAYAKRAKEIFGEFARLK